MSSFLSSYDVSDPRTAGVQSRANVPSCVCQRLEVSYFSSVSRYFKGYFHKMYAQFQGRVKYTFCEEARAAELHG